jgi:tetratricopeptide (TPR) repeat protein
MFFRRFVLFVYCLLAIHAAAKEPEHLLFKSYPVQYRYYDSIRNYFNETDSLKAIAALQKLEQWAFDKEDYQLKFIYRLARIRTISERSRQENPLVAGDVGELLDELEDHSYPLIKAEAMHLLALHYWNSRKYAAALEQFIKAHGIYKDTEDKKVPAKAVYLSEFGGKYYHFKDYNIAKKYFLQAYNINARTKTNISLTNTLALCYSKLGQNDSAEYFFGKAYAQAIKEQSDIWPGILSGNLGTIYYKQGKLDKAIPLLETDARICLEADKEVGNGVNALALLSDIYLQTGVKQKALEYADRVLDITQTKDLRGLYELKANIYYRIAGVYAANGNKDLAFALMDSSAIAKDSAFQQSNILAIQGVQVKSEAEKLIEGSRQMEREKQIERWTKYTLIAAIVMMALIGILLINRQKLRHAHARQKLETEKVQAETLLKTAEIQLADFTKSISEKNELIDKISADLRKAELSETGSSSLLQSLDELQQSTILTGAQWDNFVRIFDTVHAGFMKRLNEKVKSLSPIDIKLVLLSKLKFNNSDFARVLGVSAEAVIQNKKRLCDKLDLPGGENCLEKYADTI